VGFLFHVETHGGAGERNREEDSTIRLFAKLANILQFNAGFSKPFGTLNGRNSRFLAARAVLFLWDDS
jgi:hypothetical protein